ncbi:MAG: hypothetical protein JO316_07760 [Abitibacteriaceae bacterium]|nr:hypothetical protein [Abditibacteriaceae bacterium]
MELVEQYWLAGILEGEGSFMAGPPSKPNLPSIQMTTTDEDVAIRVASLLGVKSRAISGRRFAENGWKQAYFVVLKGERAYHLMAQLKPLMSRRRQQQIDKAMACFCKKKLGTGQLKLTDDMIREIKTSADEAKHLARRFDVHTTTIYRIRNGTRHDIPQDNVSLMIAD